MNSTIKLAAGMAALLLLAALASLLLGYQSFAPQQLLQLDNNSPASTLILEHRLPRALIAPLVGAALAVAGLLLQTLTRNPLAAPEVLSLNQGAGLAVVLLLFLQPVAPNWQLALAAALGATLSASLILALARCQRGQSLIQLPLLGAALALLFSALTQALLSLNEGTLDQALFWLAGAVSDRGMEPLLGALPLILIGFAITALLLPQLDLQQLDEQLAASLNPDADKHRRWMLLAVILLTAGSVAIAGPISFIGLITPQLLRLTGLGRHQQLLPLTALAGALLLTVSDLLARFVILPQEAPVGAVTALLGAPLFIWLIIRHTGGWQR